MKKHLLLSTIIIGLMSCHPSPKAEIVHHSLPEADIYADYPQKQMDVSRLAEVIYIPLSRKLYTEEHSYHNYFMGSVSENRIVSYTEKGDVEIFDHSGKKTGGFNRQGNTEEEYPYIFSLFLDNDRQEIWIQSAYEHFKIYALDGTFKRNITLPDRLNARVYADCSYDSLLCYDDNRVEDGLNKNPHPFYLLSKEDGKIRKQTSVRVFRRLNNVEHFSLNLEGMNHTVRFVTEASSMTVCDKKAVLADYSQDTIFRHQDGKTSPLFVRKPSVYASLPFILTSVNFMTDRFLFFSFVEKVYAKDHFQRNLLYDFQNETIYRYRLQNPDFEPALDVRTETGNGNYPSRWLVNEMTVDKFLQYHREKKLKGKAAEVIKRMRTTDTSVLILYKFNHKKIKNL